jgi:hypothetical protein
VVALVLARLLWWDGRLDWDWEGEMGAGDVHVLRDFVCGRRIEVVGRAERAFDAVK